MSELVIPRADLRQARLVETVSGWCCRSAFIARLLTGDNPLQWYATGTHADEVSRWRDFDGYPSSGLLPANYKGVAVLGTNAEALRAQAEELEGVPAAAYRLGKAVMAAQLPEAPVTAFTSESASKFTVVGFRQGRGDLNAALGVYVPEANAFVSAAEPINSYGGSYTIPEFRSSFPTAIAV